MRRLMVVYDPECGVSSRVKDWLSRQLTFIPVALVPAGSAEARRIIPQVEQLATGELLAVADDGSAWRGDNAWIVCLWALRRYRGLAFRLAGPVLRPLSSKALHLISDCRGDLSPLLELRSDQELATRLSALQMPRCAPESPVGRHDD